MRGWGWPCWGPAPCGWPPAAGPPRPARPPRSLLPAVLPAPRCPSWSVGSWCWCCPIRDHLLPPRVPPALCGGAAPLRGPCSWSAAMCRLLVPRSVALGGCILWGWFGRGDEWVPWPPACSLSPPFRVGTQSPLPAFCLGLAPLVLSPLSPVSVGKCFCGGELWAGGQNCKPLVCAGGSAGGGRCDTGCALGDPHPWLAASWLPLAP